MSPRLFLVLGAAGAAAAFVFLTRRTAARARGPGFYQMSDVRVAKRDAEVYSVRDFIRPQDVAAIYSACVLPDSDALTVLNVWSLVAGRIAYQEDPIADHWRFPLETWEDRVGDCEDGAFLLVSILLNGFPETYAAVGYLWLEGELWGHAWGLIRLRGQDYVLESTLDELPLNPWVTKQEVADTYIPCCYFNSVIWVAPGYQSLMRPLPRRYGKREALARYWRNAIPANVGIGGH